MGGVDNGSDANSVFLHLHDWQPYKFRWVRVPILGFERVRLQEEVRVRERNFPLGSQKRPSPSTMSRWHGNLGKRALTSTFHKWQQTESPRSARRVSGEVTLISSTLRSAQRLSTTGPGTANTALRITTAHSKLR